MKNFTKYFFALVFAISFAGNAVAQTPTSRETMVCSGTPYPGNTLSTAYTVCPNVSFTLSYSGSLPAEATVQWQSSPNASAWTDIGGATNPTCPIASITASTYYRVKANCNGNINYSNYQLITFQPNPSGTISYTPNNVCQSYPNYLYVTSNNLSSGGTYSATPAGLVFGSIYSGYINPSSPVGTYNVVYTVPAANGCNAYTTPPATITITASPSGTFTYSSTSYCQSSGTVSPILSTPFSTGGTWSAGTGLTINASTGVITPTSSTPGTYNVIYTIPATATCGTFTTSRSITITPATAGTFSYSPTSYCTNWNNYVYPVTTNLSTGGTYSVTPTGLNSFNSAYGYFIAANSTPGTYTVTYTIPAGNGCAASSTTATVTITQGPSGTFTYPSPICKASGPVLPTTSSLTTGGTWTASPSTGLSLNSTTGEITPATSTQGTYTVTYTIPASTGCYAFIYSRTVVINNATIGTFSYTNPQYCNSYNGWVTPNNTNLNPGGTFTSTAGLYLSSLGEVYPPNSTPGNYTVTYTLNPGLGCTPQTTTATINISAQPTGSFSYSPTTYCQSVTSVNPTTTSLTTGGTYTAPTGLSINASTGVVNPSASTVGTYTVTYNIPAANGCNAYSTTAQVIISGGGTGTIAYSPNSVCTNFGTMYANNTNLTPGGTYTSTTGLYIGNASSGWISPPNSTPGTYTVTYSVNPGQGCATYTTTAPLTITAAPSGSFSYPNSTYCQNAGTIAPTITNLTSGGTFSSSAGLSISATTGVINAAASIPGGYYVYYNIPAATGCNAFQTYAYLQILANGTGTFTYGAGPFCTSGGWIYPTNTGLTSGGSYSSTTGLYLQSSGGGIHLGSSTPGTYTVTYTYNPGSGCTPYTTTAQLTITSGSSGSFSYSGSPYCSGASPQSPTTVNLTSGGTYSAPAGLSINSTTGVITPASSTAGTYTVTYSVPASGGCSAWSTTASVTIATGGSGTFSYATNPVCSNAGFLSPTNSGLPAGGTYNSTTGLSINASTGVINTGASTAGTYTVTYTVTSGTGCGAYSTTAPITIAAYPSGNFSYTGTPFCQTSTSVTPNTTGLTTGGTFTASSGLVLNSTTGVINPSTSLQGSYTITYTIPASGPCPAFTTTTNIVINQGGSGTFSYPSSPYCSNGGIVSPQNSGLTSGGTYSSTSGLVFNNSSTGAINLGLSNPGTYTVTYTVTPGNGCPPYSTTASITITALGSGSFSYAGSPYATTVTTASPTLTNLTTGGTFSAPAGLNINATTGVVNPSASIAGTYTVTYSIPAANGCPAFSTTASITISACGSGSFTYSGSPYCTSTGSASPTTNALSAGGTYTAGAGLNINASSGVVNLSLSSPGTYTVTYTFNGGTGCSVYTTTAQIIVVGASTGSFSYAGTPFCSNAPAATPITTGLTTGGTFSAPGGLTINATTGQITPASSTPSTYTVTYTVPANGPCAVYTTTAPVTITAQPGGTFAYNGSPFCSNGSTVAPTYTNLTSGGSYSGTQGLILNSANGVITLTGSTPGNHTVTYTVPAGSGCTAYTTTASFTITEMPSGIFSYAGSPYCSTSSTVSPNTTGLTMGGVFSAPAGLVINGSSGVVTANTSTPGTYTVTYSYAAHGGCQAFSTTANITIGAAPSGSFTYGSNPYCSNLTNVPPTNNLLSSGGTYTSTSGLSINATTGVVNPSLSTGGTYTVTYAIPAQSGCPAFSTTATITITTNPSGTFSYTALSYCTTAGNVLPASTLSSGGTFSSTPGLAINSTTGSINTGSSTPGTYTVTYTIAAAGGCATFTANASVTITAAPSGTFSYSGTPYCTNSSAATVTPVNLTSGGTYTSAPSGLNINSATGTVNTGLSTAGTYTVTYTVAAGSGCPAYSTTATIVITQQPSGTFAYTGSPYCATASTAAPTNSSLTTGGTFSANPGLVINGTTGVVTPSASIPGTYTVTYSVPAAGGCAAWSTTATMVINAYPSGTFSYASPFCNTISSASPTSVSLTTGGTFSASPPSGLYMVNNSTGVISPSQSTPGTYTVTYSVPAGTGCAPYTTTAQVIITQNPSGTFAYSGTPYCATASPVLPTNTNLTAGGTYSSVAGLVINGTNGQISPASSTPGTYTVTYSIPALGGCNPFSTTASVTINPLANGTFSYPGSPFCSSATTGVPTPVNLPSGGTYSSTSGLYFVNSTSGQINPSLSTPGTYTVTYSVNVGTGCANYTTTSQVIITEMPHGTFAYNNPYCASATSATITPTNLTIGGTFTANPGLVINPSTGTVTPASSTPGTYVVTYNIPAAGGCASYTTTASIVISNAVSGSFAYTNNPFCNNAVNAVPVISNLPTGGAFSATPSGLYFVNNATGEISPTLSAPGVYNVTYTVNAGNGCPAYTAASSVTITEIPHGTFSYVNSPYCATHPSASPTAGLGGLTPGGTYSSTTGLVINASTGVISPASSIPGTYTVNYDVPALGGCQAYHTQTQVTILPTPGGTFYYSGSPFCTSAPFGVPTTLTLTLGGTFTSSPAGLNVNASTGTITPGLSTGGSYTVTYSVTSGYGCPNYVTTTPVNVTTQPAGTFSYPSSPYSTSATTATPVAGTGGLTPGGTYTSSLGLSLNLSTGVVNPSLSTPGTYTVVYTIVAGGGCQQFTTQANIQITPCPTGTIAYNSSPYCTTVSSAAVTTTNLTTGGIYTASPAGLSINPSTGAITPSTSNVGTYTVTYTIAAGGGCPTFTTTAQVVITQAPSGTFSYGANPFCTSATSASPTGTGLTSGGTYSAPAGVSINASTGVVNPSASTAGTYTITYNVAAAGGCAAYSTTAPITISTAPSGSFAYGGTPYCNNATASTPTNTGLSTGGTYSAPTGLSINSTTGAINPSASTVGTYTVTYNLPAQNGCAAYSTTAQVVITPLPSGTFSYGANPFCTSATAASPTGTSLTTGGTYSAPAGVSINASTGVVNPSASTAGTYIISYNVAAAGGCAAYSTTAPITISTAPSGSFAYGGTPYCNNATASTPTTTGLSTGGTYSAPTGLSINSNTGAINPSASTAGTYTVTYNLPAQNGCAAYTTTAQVVITQAGGGTFTYAGSPYCTSATTASPTGVMTGNGTYSAPVGLSINTTTGVINPSASTPGTYTVTYNVAAGGGCAAYNTTAQVSVSQAPSGTFSFAGSPYCAATAPVNPTNVGLTPGGTYTAGTGLTINPTTGQITPSTSTPGSYTITYSIPAANGCAAFSTTATIGIGTPSTAPTGITATTNTVCSPGGNVTMTVNGGSLGTTAVWRWYTGSCGGTLVGTGNSITVPVSATTTYFVRAEGVCNTTACASTTINIAPSPDVTISSNNNNTTSPYGFTTLTASVVPAVPTTGSYTYTWYNLGQPVGTTTTPTWNINASQYGFYHVVVTNGTCPDTSNQILITPKQVQSVHISPNPGNGMFLVRIWNYTPSANSYQSVVVYDSKGARIFTKRYYTNGYYTDISVDITKAQKGTYYVAVMSDDNKLLGTGEYLLLRN